MKREMKKNGKSESVLRFIATCLLLLIACLIRTNSQTKFLFDYLEKKATFRDIYVFVVQFYVVCVAAGYSFLQMMRCLFMSEEEDTNLTYLKHLLLTTTFLLDQIVVYVVFATNSASTAASLVAITGNESLQWEKVCNIYSRFCHQVGGYLLLGFVASLVLAYISSLSAFFLFRLYSSSHFLRLKRQPLVNAF